MRVFLVGFMGSGKTTTGRALARLRGSLFLDLDARVEAVLGKPVPAIFRDHGEEVFRAAETALLARCERFPEAVVATGGGTFQREPNRDLIARLGVSVYLEVGWDEILRRLPGKRDERPLFAEPEQALALYRARLPGYRTADLRVAPAPGEAPELVAARVAALLETLT